MVRIHSKLIALAVTLLLPLQSFAEINIFACEPEWASLAEEIGGEKVKVFSATTAQQDPHYIQARPSLIAKTRKADLLVCTGAELEVGWLPLLVRKAGKKSIQQGNQGYFMASDFIDNKLEIPEVLDRSMGDVHSAGNPHVHLNPYNILIIAEQLQKRLIAMDKTNATSYQENFSRFSQKWQAQITLWEEKAASLKGKKVIVYHKSFSYLLDWLDINMVADLEPKPGIPPTSSHLADVLVIQENEKADMLLHAPYQNKKPVKWLTKKTGITEVELPFTVGGNKKAVDLITLFDEHIDLLLN